MIKKIIRTVYSFGSPCDTIYGKLVLKEDGTIYGYSHPNETFWRLENDELLLISYDGNVTSRYKSDGMNNWIGHLEGKKWPMFLHQLIVLDPVVQSTLPNVFVTSILKSGTYFIESALENIGIIPTRIHIPADGGLFDYRGMSNNQIHYDSESVSLSCPTDMITCLLNGEVLIGHNQNINTINNIRQQGVCVISVVRNLRDVIVSLFKFRYSKVKPINLLDRYWREMPLEKRLESFLIFNEGIEFPHIRNIAHMILSDENAILLRYEDMIEGRISQEATNQLDTFYPDFSQKLSQALISVKDQETPTYSGKRSDWKELWNDDVERYFLESGMYELNQRLGYE